MESEDRKPIFTKRLILIVLAVILLALIIFLLLRKCGNGGEGDRVFAVYLSPTHVGIEVGQTYPISSDVKPDNAKNKALMWSSSNDSVVTVDQAGLIFGIGEGTATVTAASLDTANVFGEVIVTVGKSLPNLTQIQLNKETYSVKVGKKVLVEVTPYPSSALLTDIQYSIVDPTIATVDVDGVITGKKAGTTTIIVSANSGGVSATATVKVTKASSSSGSSGKTPSSGGTISKPTRVDVTSINYNDEGCYKLRVGNNYTLSPILIPTKATELKLLWESSNPEVANVDRTGLVTASTKTGTTIIKVTAESGVFATYEIRVVSKTAKEGSCKASSGSSGGSNGGSNGGKTTSTTIEPGTYTYSPEPKEIEIENKKYNISINSDVTIEGFGTDGYVKSANCTLRLSGYVPFSRTFYCIGNDDNCIEFDKIANFEISSRNAYVKMVVYDVFYKQILNSKIFSNVCYYKDKPISIDKIEPTCDEISYDPYERKINLKVNDENGIDKIEWNTGAAVYNQFETTLKVTETGKYVAVFYDKAGNAASCGVDITHLDKSSTPMTDSTNLDIFTGIEIEISATNKTSSNSKDLMATYNVYELYKLEGKVKVKVNDSNSYIVEGCPEFFDCSSKGKISIINSYIDNAFDKDTIKEVILKIRSTKNGDLTDSKTIKFIRDYVNVQDYIECYVISSENPFQDSRGLWHKGNLAFTCEVNDAGKNKILITETKACIASADSKCSPNMSTSKNDANIKFGKITGQYRIFYEYTVKVNGVLYDKITPDKPMPLINYDNFSPSCNVSIVDNMVFRYDIDDGDYSSGLDVLYRKNFGNYKFNESPSSVTITEKPTTKPAEGEKACDFVGNCGKCDITSIGDVNDAVLDSMTSNLTTALGNKKVMLKEWNKNGEYYEEDREGKIKLKENLKITVAVCYTTGDSCEPQMSETTASILNLMRKFDDTQFDWYADGTVFKIDSQQSSSKVTFKVGQGGKGWIKACVKGTDKNGTNNCLKIVEYVTTPPPREISILESNTMMLGASKMLRLSYSPTYASREISVTSSDPSVIAVDNSGTTVKITAKKVGKSTITVESSKNAGVTSNITINVLSNSLSCSMSYDEENNQIIVVTSATASDGSFKDYGYIGSDKRWTKSGIIPGRTYVFEYETLSADQGFGTCEITIPKKINIPIIGSEKLTSGSTSNLFAQPTADFIPRDNSYSWQSSNTKCITLSNNSAKSPIATAGNVSTACTSTITLNAKDASGKSASGSITITVNPKDGGNTNSYEIPITGTQTLTAGSTTTLLALITEEFVPDNSYKWQSFNDKCVTIRSSGARKATATAMNVTSNCTSKITFTAKDASGKTGSGSITITVNPKENTKLTAPTISFDCSTSEYDGTTWCKYGLAMYTHGIPSGAITKTCRTTSTAKCDPFTGSYSTIMESGTYTVCAGYIQNSQNSEVGCKTITAKIDKVAPTCTFSIIRSGGTLEARCSDSGSGISYYSDGWTNEGNNMFTRNISGLTTNQNYTITLKDKAGNQYSTSVKVNVSSKKTCTQSGYIYKSEYNSTNCIKHDDAAEFGDWSNPTVTYVKECQAISVPAREVSCTTYTEGPDCSAHRLDPPCYKKIEKTRKRDHCTTEGAVIYNGTYCYLIGNKLSTTYTRTIAK